MFIIWRGKGWLVPAIVIVVFCATQFTVNTVAGDWAYYTAHEWPKYVAVAMSSLVVVAAGFYFNHARRLTGKSSHALFFIRMEVWGAIIPLVFLWVSSHTRAADERDMGYINAPEIGDLYVVDFSKLSEGSDNPFKYGVLRAFGTERQHVIARASVSAYKESAGPERDIREQRADADSYYSVHALRLEHVDLVELKRRDAILSVTRSGE